MGKSYATLIHDFFVVTPEGAGKFLTWCIIAEGVLKPSDFFERGIFSIYWVFLDRVEACLKFEVALFLKTYFFFFKLHAKTLFKSHIGPWPYRYTMVDTYQLLQNDIYHKYYIIHIMWSYLEGGFAILYAFVYSQAMWINITMSVTFLTTLNHT